MYFVPFSLANNAFCDNEHIVSNYYYNIAVLFESKFPTIISHIVFSN